MKSKEHPHYILYRTQGETYHFINHFIVDMTISDVLIQIFSIPNTQSPTLFREETFTVHHILLTSGKNTM